MKRGLPHGGSHRKGQFEGNGRRPTSPIAEAVEVDVVLKVHTNGNVEHVVDLQDARPHENVESISIEVGRIMDEWEEVRAGVKERLGEGRRPYDPRLHQEKELMLICAVIVDSFRFGNGSVPNELSEATDEGMAWNFPEFARMIEKRAHAAKLETEGFMRRAFIPILNHEEAAASKVILGLLGQEFYIQADVQERMPRVAMKKTKQPKQNNPAPDDLDRTERRIGGAGKIASSTPPPP